MISTPETCLSASGWDAPALGSEALVVGVAESPSGPLLLDNPLTEEYSRTLAQSLKDLGISGAVDEMHRLVPCPEAGLPLLVLAGVGKLVEDQSLDPEALRRAAGSVIRQLTEVSTVELAFPLEGPTDVAAVAEGAALGAYSFTDYRSPLENRPTPVRNVVVRTHFADHPESGPALKRAAIVGRAVNTTRSLVNQPPSHLYPESFADAAQELAGGLPITVTIWDETRLAKEGFGGIIGVGQGSARQPRLVKLDYAPAAPTTKMALVGKGITFDTGGISIKTSPDTPEMKADMAGAAVVLSTVLAIAELGLPVHVTGWLCLAENMPSGSALRPADILTMYNGKTVEVLNTDAEGRLVLADGIAAASQEFPDAIIDVATLTGAQRIALGNRTAGLMGTSELVSSLKAAADRAGEEVWPMPLTEELRPSLDSQIADIANLGAGYGGMMTAAVFLQEFVGNDSKGWPIPWAHIDIVGPSFNRGGAYGYTPRQGTGCTVRTLVAYVENEAAKRHLHLNKPV